MAAVEFTQVVSRGCGMDIHKVVANAVLGGVVSELGGGKFANGAMTAAYTMMFNDLAHIGPTYKQLEKIMKIYKECKSLYDTPEAFYESLGGDIAYAAKSNPEMFSNTCAARLSQAMNKSGLVIPYIQGKTIMGSNQMNYFIRASDMKKYFISLWGNPRIIARPTNVKNGIVFQNGFSGVSGHVDVFYKGRSGGAAYLYYWNTDGRHSSITTELWKYGK